MLRRSAREIKVPARFVENGQEETGTPLQSETAATPSISSICVVKLEEFSEEEPSSTSTGTRCGRSGISTRGQGSRQFDAAGDAPRSRSPHRQEAWKTEEDPDLSEPQPLRFFPKRNPGPQPPLTPDTSTPDEIFCSFFDAEVLRLLCENTNKNAQKHLEKGQWFAWREITPQELKKYLGLVLFMSVCSLPKISDFWRKNALFQVPFPATVMSRDRFMTISRKLHISDPEDDAVNEQKKGTEDYDPLQKVRPLLDVIRNTCRSIYHPRQHILVDERMVATKASPSVKQYMKAKPTKRALKFFLLTDVNGYTVDFNLYRGKTQVASGKGLPFDVLAELVNKDYLGSGYIVYCDNSYTSPLLFHHLSQQGFGACGTYREGIDGVPTTMENALDKKSKRGSIRWIRDGDLLFVKWMDIREVSLCTTIHPVFTGETVLRWQVTDGHNQRVPVPRPTAVGEYNKYMGGADTSDQILVTNSVHRKTRRWPMTVFHHVLDIAVTNSFIIHKELSMGKQQKPLTRQAFQEELCAQLLGVPLNGPPKPPTEGHYPISTSNREYTGERHRASMGRKQCTLCKRSTPWMCGECKVGLCLQLDRNCFRNFHCPI